MSIRCLPGLVVIALAGIASSTSTAADSAAPVRQFSGTALLYQTSTAGVLPAGALAVSANRTYPLVNTPKNVNHTEVDASVRFSPFKHLDFALTAYTFADYVLDAKYQILGGDPDRLGLAIGVCDVGRNSHVSPGGHDTASAWPDWKYGKYLPRHDRPTERFSAFAVTSIPVTRFTRLHVGLGRGRFVEYDIHSKYLNIDYFFDEYHQWAFGLFGGVEVYVTPQVALTAEASGRDMNSGIKANFGPVSAAVAWTKMEGLLPSHGDGRFGRLEVGVSHQVDKAFQYRGPEVPLYHVEPAPEPDEQPAAAPTLEKLRLYAIWFEWDKSDVTPVAEATLRRNAEVLLTHPNVHIVITATRPRRAHLSTTSRWRDAGRKQHSSISNHWACRNSSCATGPWASRPAVPGAPVGVFRD